MFMNLEKTKAKSSRERHVVETSPQESHNQCSSNGQPSQWWMVLVANCSEQNDEEDCSCNVLVLFF